MRLRCSKGIAFRALKRSPICPACLVQTQQRNFSSHEGTAPDRKKIAVLGGGITGLTSAFYLSKNSPDAHITLYEKTSRLGGWIDSERVQVDGGDILFEHGPHTLRPGGVAGLIPLELIKELNLEDELIRTSSNSAAARNRYIYYPDHLVRLPAPLPGASTLMNVMRNAMSLATEPLYGGWLSLLALMKEPFLEPRSRWVEDESIGSFLSRRFGQAVADNIASAGLHGVYAGDIYQLSARTLLPLPYALELKNSRVWASFIALAKNGKIMSKRDQNFIQAFSKHQDSPKYAHRKSLPNMDGISVYTLKRGLGQLVEALVQHLRKADNVTIETEMDIRSMTFSPDTKGITVEFPPESLIKSPHRYQHVLSTISPRNLTEILTPIPKGSPTKTIDDPPHAVTVMVVNLWYPNPRLLPVQGFGYLIPRSIAYEQNPEHALGVIFASESSAGQDTVPGTKLTVMFGGHWWDGWSAYPTEEEGVQMAKSLLERHLSIRDEPVRTSVRLQENCIPQYRVGYRKKLDRIHTDLKKFEGRIRVAGSWYHGVGLNDCIRSAMEVAEGISSEGEEEHTGLEWAVKDPEYVLVKTERDVTPLDDLLS